MSDREQIARLGAHVEASRPEPPPVPRGEPVSKWLIALLSMDGFDATADVVRARDAFGREKYGQPLMTEDGRDGVEDALQELGDAAQYIFKAAATGQDVEPLREHVRALVALINRAGAIRAAFGAKP